MFIIEAAEGLQLLKEGDKHARVVFVGSRQVDVLQVQDEALTVSRSVNPSVRSTEQAARLRHLLHFVNRAARRTVSRKHVMESRLEMSFRSSKNARVLAILILTITSCVKTTFFYAGR